MRDRLDGKLPAKVKFLHRLTGASLLDAARAVAEAGGDVDRAVQILRAKRLPGAVRPEARPASGAIVACVSEGNTSGVLLELRCQSDFVAKGEKFRALAQGIAEHVAKTSPADIEALLVSEIHPGETVQALIEVACEALSEKITCSRFAQFTGGYVAAELRRTMPDHPPQIGALVQFKQGNAKVARDIAQHIIAFGPKYLSRQHVPEETVESERLLAETNARHEDNPETALSDIVDGRMNDFFQRYALLEQPFIHAPEKTVQTVLDEAGVRLTRFARFRVGLEET
ncbi:translation elongation factor Ts [Streptomyces sp. NPDC056361]|uniref:translation elongation factor Ts n=1 Tax=Streptomyces sp. NPDC056361 TaxID=3345795 RepID=UPI0035E30CD3